MNIAREDIDALNTVVRVNIEKADYAEKVSKALKEQRKKAVIKGFRPGMAPESLIHKMYYKYILVEEVSRMASDKLFDFIKDNNIKTLGEPLPSENQSKINWDTDENFELAWDLGIAPEFDIKFGKKDKFPFYKIQPNDEIRKNFNESHRSRHGKYEPVKKTDEKGLVKATLSELNEDESPRENGVTVEGASISIALVADETERKKLVGVKVGDVLTIDTEKAFPNQADRAALLHTKKENLEGIQPLFQLTITETMAFVAAELNQEFFDKVYGEGVVTSEEDFNKKIDEEIERNLDLESENRFALDIKDKMLDKLKMELPKEFLIRWLVAINEGKFTREQIEAEFPLFEKDLKWQLVSNKVAEEQKFNVTEDELREFAMGYARSQFAAYGMNFLPEEYIARYANDILKNREEMKKIHERILDKKVVDWFKENVTLDTKEVSVDEFNKL
ncbi:trigger factor [Tenuifilaceae bacterium CYCD]|nr:trigger factor [Tenuifilaceae bacterium CYCD]